MKYFSLTFTLLTILTLSLSVRPSSAGSLDPTFGTGGTVFGTIPGFHPYDIGIALQSDGKIILVGALTGPDSTSDFAVARLNPDGTTDGSFGTNGLVGISYDTNAQEMAVAATVQPDGKIIVVGLAEFGSPSWDFAVARLNQNGSLDAGFGNGGKVKINVGGADYVSDVALQSDGKIIVVGKSRPTPNDDGSIIRLTTNGQLDTSFNGTGKVIIPIGGGSTNDSLNSVLIQTDGKIVAAGYGGTDLAVLRFNSNGTFDTTFDGDGKVLTAIGAHSTVANSVAVQTDGKLIAGGTGNSGSGGQAAFVRYNPNGSIDTTFGTNGKILVDAIPSEQTLITTVLVDSDNRMLALGASRGFSVMMRFQPNGVLDPEFGVGGKLIIRTADSTSDISDGILQPDGKLVVVGGGSSSNNYGISAARFLMEKMSVSTAPFDFDGDGRTDVGIFRPSVGQWWWTRSSDSEVQAVTFGSASDSIVPVDFTGDGKTDVGLWRPSTGEWFVLRSEDFTYYAFPFGADGDIAMPADYDGDGKADAAVFRPSTGMWYINRSSDGAVTTTQFGAAGDRPVTADYDGDGTDDIAVFRPNGTNGAEWWLLRSKDGLLGLQFGSATDMAIPGDYTGDGKTDVAFWRPADGFWHIIRSEDLSYYGYPFGTNGDVPAPGDYDGDGKFDAAVFRPSTGTWYINNSTGGTIAVPFGSSGDQPVPSAFGH